ncbi:hypothetical protein M378DRAFT_174136 [Amanita muscaria Koide BX008]|uniref:Uncharacterized protein n=1 Tax=Amanita muscaria (strain Koide BX008) TaxID=946122 RepID=A0A0C2RWH1_AMAMK|nr:hypothetical protein M378DRAFT_174136 [Amanita muscaria Koide BX008]
MLSVLQLIPARLGPPTAISHMNPLVKVNLSPFRDCPVVSSDDGVINGDATPCQPSFMQTHSSMLRMSSASELQGASRCKTGGEELPPPAAAAPSVELYLSTSTVVEAIWTYIRMVPFPTTIALPIFLFPPLPNPSSEFDADANESDDDGDIIELDFEETSGLSDTKAFNKAQTKGKEKKLSSRNGPMNSAMSAGGSAGSGLERQKKTRKEKEVEKREQIENSWDAPAPVPNPLPSPDVRRLSSEQMYISDNLDVHIVIICHEHSRCS